MLTNLPYTPARRSALRELPLQRCPVPLAAPLCWLALGLFAGPAQARTITVTPADDYHPIEAAQPGDIVEIAPGTYHFRVSLEVGGMAAQPILIRAQDPARRPVWDLGGAPVSSAPGSYTADDKGRGCWQVRAGHYHIQGIVFKNCVDADSAGVRVVNVPDVSLTSCLFQDNTNGVTGAGDDLVIAFSEFTGNGLGTGAHSLYTYGGTLDVRYSFFHDSPKGQHFHIRSRDAVLAYNWFTRPGSYPGDLMACEHFCGGTSVTQPITQHLLLLGNVIVQGTPANPSKLVTLYKDETNSVVDGTGVVTGMELTMINNTLIGTHAKGASDAAVQLRNDTVTAALHASNNLAVGFTTFTELQVAGNDTIDGAGNWVTTGTTTMGLTASQVGADPGLSAGYVPTMQSPVRGTAVAASQRPAFEYYRDETVTAMGRARASVKDPGAFESTTTSAAFGAGGAPDGGAGGDLGAAADLGGQNVGDGPGGPHGSGCTAGAGAVGSWPPGWGLLLGLALLRRRRARA